VGLGGGGAAKISETAGIEGGAFCESVYMVAASGMSALLKSSRDRPALGSILSFNVSLTSCREHALNKPAQQKSTRRVRNSFSKHRIIAVPNDKFRYRQLTVYIKCIGLV
jgi:hypothetical protein